MTLTPEELAAIRERDKHWSTGPQVIKHSGEGGDVNDAVLDRRALLQLIDTPASSRKALYRSLINWLNSGCG